jgi:hypothetical protein
LTYSLDNFINNNNNINNNNINNNDINFYEINFENSNSNQVYGSFIEYSSFEYGGLIYLFTNPSNKILIPLTDKLKLKECNWFDDFEDINNFSVKILNLENFNELKKKYFNIIEKEKNKIILNNENKNKIKRKMIFLCEDLILNLGIGKK